MKTITYKKTIQVDATIEFPTITFVPEKVRISPNGDTSWFVMAYTARFNGLKVYDYYKEMGMDYKVANNMLKEYVKENFNNKHDGYGSIDWYYYSGKDLNLPELPKLTDDGFSDDHAKLVAMFKQI
jgi:hypothetical protein